MATASSAYNAKTKYSALDTARDVKDSIARVHDKLSKFVVFVRTDHITVETLQAYWRQERRATLTLETLSRTLGVDVPDAVTTVRNLLSATDYISLPDFAANDAPDLFATIDSIVPDEYLVGDGRVAVERFQFAAELRSALLNYSLSLLSKRYPSTPFTSLSLATEWTRAFSMLLQEVEEIIVQTQQLLCDEATAAQSYLDQFRNDLELLDMQARNAALLMRNDWHRVLADTERQILDTLEIRHSRLAALTFGELRETRQSGWLEVIAKTTMKHAPQLGALLLTLAGSATLIVPALQARGQAAPALPAPDEVARTGTFPVLARHVVPDVSEFATRIADEVSAFFNAMPKPRGRVSLTIPDPYTLGRVVDELGAFGYAKAEILQLLGLSSVDAVTQPLSLDMRWSQGGRPLLLPPYMAQAQEIAAASTPLAAEPNTLSLSDLTAGFGRRAEAVIGSLNTAAMPIVAPQEVAPPVAAPVPVPTASGVLFEGEARPISSMVVHYVQGGEDLNAIAAKYSTTVEAITADNQLTGGVEYGQMLLVRVNGRVVESTSTPPAILTGAAGVQSSGSFPVASAAPTGGDVYGNIVDKYGSTLYPTINDMPDDARQYFTQTVQEVADFFNVRPGDIIGILQAENNNAGLRIYQPAVSSAGAMGVGQIVTRTWNGWANPETVTPLLDMRSIEQYGGLGFDWASREAWRAWQEGRASESVLANTNADPYRFDNNIAGVARHLVHWGLTRDVAAKDPTGFQSVLADAISVYNSGHTLADAENFVQSADNPKTTGDYVREAVAIANATPTNLTGAAVATTPSLSPLHTAYTRLMDQYFGSQPSGQELAERVDGSISASDVAAGKVSADQGARDLFNQTVQHYIAQGRAAQNAGQPLPWPFIYNEETLAIQQTAVQFLGHSLSGAEVRDLVNQYSGNRDAITQAIATRDDARLFAGARVRFDRLLQRTERGMTIYNYEVSAQLQPLLAGYPTRGISDDTLQNILSQFEAAVRHSSEYRSINGVTGFSAMPFSPMPGITKGFGVPVDYQAGGVHTGVDFSAPIDPKTGEPTIMAVEGGIVTYVGPLYCDADTACRGEHAVVIDHGNNVYTIYSHNSEADVVAGQVVQAGQAIARQGDEGYSFGSHLHLEVHTGAAFSGDWTEPFKGGTFEDPMKWLPN